MVRKEVIWNHDKDKIEKYDIDIEHSLLPWVIDKIWKKKKKRCQNYETTISRFKQEQTRDK